MQLSCAYKASFSLQNSGCYSHVICVCLPGCLSIHIHTHSLELYYICYMCMRRRIRNETFRNITYPKDAACRTPAPYFAFLIFVSAEAMPLHLGIEHISMCVCLVSVTHLQPHISICLYLVHSMWDMRHSIGYVDPLLLHITTENMFVSTRVQHNEYN